MVTVLPYRPYFYRPSIALGVYYGADNLYPFGAIPSYYYDPSPGASLGGVRITDAPRDAQVFADGYYAGIVDDFDGEVPPRLDDLVTLPGVGRKTANVVLGNAFGLPGITVDTHFGRLARRLGWTEETDPVKVEHAVGALFPRRDWTMLSHHLIWHGRRRCHARPRRPPDRPHADADRAPACARAACPSRRSACRRPRGSPVQC